MWSINWRVSGLSWYKRLYCCNIFLLTTADSPQVLHRLMSTLFIQGHQVFPTSKWTRPLIKFDPPLFLPFMCDVESQFTPFKAYVSYNLSEIFHSFHSCTCLISVASTAHSSTSSHLAHCIHNLRKFHWTRQTLYPHQVFPTSQSTNYPSYHLVHCWICAIFHHVCHWRLQALLHPKQNQFSQLFTTKQLLLQAGHNILTIKSRKYIWRHVFTCFLIVGSFSL